MNKFNRFAALRWVYNIIVPPRYRDKLNITEELCAFESTLNKVIEVTNANGRALEAISKDLEDIQFGAGGYYRPAITENEDGSVTFSFTASNDSMPPIEEKTFFLGDMQTITEMLEGFTGEPMAVKNYIDEMSGGYYTPVFEQNDSTVQVSFLASNKMLPTLDGYSFTLPSGPTGKSAYDSYLDNGGTLTEKDWVNSLKGEDGESFYQMCVKNGFKGSETDLVIAMKGDPYELTESDITTIVQRVVENLGGQPVAGYFDENNDIVLTSTLPDGTYTFKIETSDGVYELGTLTKKTTVNKYTVTFMADGQTVKVVEYTEGDDTLTEVPSVPVKDGYTGAWEPYDLSEGGNITVNAVYTAVETEPDEPTAPTNFANPSDPYWQRGYRLATGYGYGKPCEGHLLTNFIPAMKGDEVYVTGLNLVDFFNSQHSYVGAFTGNSVSESDTSNYAKKYTTTSIRGSDSDSGAENSVAITTNSDGTKTYSYTVLMLDGTDNTPNYRNVAPNTTAYIRISATTIDGVSDSDIVINVKRNGVWL